MRIFVIAETHAPYRIEPHPQPLAVVGIGGVPPDDECAVARGTPLLRADRYALRYAHPVRQRNPVFASIDRSAALIVVSGSDEHQIPGDRGFYSLLDRLECLRPRCAVVSGIVRKRAIHIIRLEAIGARACDSRDRNRYDVFSSHMHWFSSRKNRTLLHLQKQNHTNPNFHDLVHE